MYAQDERTGVTLEQLVKEATNEMLLEPDFSKAVDLVDRINASGKANKKRRCAELVGALAKRLDGKKRVENVVYLCMHLIDFCVKNLQPEMPRLAAGPTLQKVIIKVGKARGTKGRARQIIIEKVQEWSYIFQHLGGFQETYIALQKAGLEFPMPSKELIAEQTKLNTERIERAERAKEKKRMSSPAGKLEQNLLVLEDNLLMVSQMLSVVDPTQEDVSKHELIPPLISSVSQQRPKIADLIVNCQDESLMETLLKVNDDINNVMTWYEQLVKGEKPNFPEWLLPVEPHNDAAQPEGDLLGGLESLSMQSPPPRASAPPSSQDDNDPFAAFAASRTQRKRGSGVASPGPQAAAPAASPVNPLDALFGLGSSNTGGPAMTPTSPSAMLFPSQPMSSPPQQQQFQGSFAPQQFQVQSPPTSGSQSAAYPPQQHPSPALQSAASPQMMAYSPQQQLSPPTSGGTAVSSQPMAYSMQPPQQFQAQSSPTSGGTAVSSQPMAYSMQPPQQFQAQSPPTSGGTAVSSQPMAYSMQPQQQFQAQSPPMSGSQQPSPFAPQPQQPMAYQSGSQMNAFTPTTGSSSAFTPQPAQSMTQAQPSSTSQLFNDNPFSSAPAPQQQPQAPASPNPFDSFLK